MRMSVCILVCLLCLGFIQALAQMNVGFTYQDDLMLNTSPGMCNFDFAWLEVTACDARTGHVFTTFASNFVIASPIPFLDSIFQIKELTR